MSKYDLEQSEMCQFCNINPEYITHLLFECTFAKQFWNKLTNILNTKCIYVKNLKFSKNLVILGSSNDHKSDRVLDLIIIMGKYYLYRCKVKECLPIVNHFIYDIYYIYKVEKYSSRKSENKIKNFTNKWLNYENIFKGLLRE